MRYCSPRLPIPRCCSPAALLLFLAVACGDGTDAPSTSSFRTVDSAGVAIALNGMPGSDLKSWTVDSAPALLIGVTMGDPAYEFGRINRVSRLPGRVIGVVNGIGESYVEMRFYDSTGAHLASHGRRGEGPGEYRWINFFGSVGGDTVLANDWPHSRLSLVSISQGYLGSTTYSEERFREFLGEDAYGLGETMIPLSDSAYAIKAYRPIPEAMRSGRRGQSYHLVDLHRDTVFNLLRFDDPEVVTLPMSTGSMRVSPAEGGSPWHVVDRSRERLCAAVTSVAEIQCVDREGRRLRIRWEHELLPITEGYRKATNDALRSAWASTGNRTRADAEQYIAARTFPEFFNPFVLLMNDTDGNFWVLERHALDSDDRPLMRYRIFDPDGRQIAVANDFPVPVLLHGIEIGASEVIRVVRDSLDVQRVGVFRIRKGG